MAEPGRYRARAVQAALCETKAGNEQLAIEFALYDVDGVEGEHVTYFGSFSEAALPHTVKALRTCGWQGADLSNLSGVDTNEVSLVLENEEYEGRVRTKVKWVNPPTTGLSVKAPLDADRARVFAATMRARILGLDAQGGIRPQVGPKPLPPRGAPAAQSPRKGGAIAPEPPPINEDPAYTEDIPF